MKNRIIASVIITLILGVLVIINIPIENTDESVDWQDTLSSTTSTTTTVETTKTTLLKANKKKKKKTAKKKTSKKKKSTTKKKTYAVHTSSECKQFAYNELVDRYGWDDEDDWSALVQLWNRESGWRYNAKNNRGCYGIPQACPGNKMKKNGKDWKTNCYTQINWGLGYIATKYGNPRNALKHSKKYGWY